MADYAKEMKALEGMITQEEANEMFQRDRYNDGAQIANMMTPISKPSQGSAEILLKSQPMDRSAEMEMAWTGGAKNDYAASVDRQKRLLDKYKVMAGLQSDERKLDYLKSKHASDANKANQKVKEDQIALVEKLADRLKKDKDDFQTVQNAYQNVQTVLKGGSTGLGQVASLYSFVKVLDPGSVVREGEISLANSANPLLQKLGMTYNIDKIQKGKILPESLMRDLNQVVTSLYENKKAGFIENIKREAATAKTYGISDQYIDSALTGRYTPGGQSNDQKKQIQPVPVMKPVSLDVADDELDTMSDDELQFLYNQTKEVE